MEVPLSPIHAQSCLSVEPELRQYVATIWVSKIKEMSGKGLALAPQFGTEKYSKVYLVNISHEVQASRNMTISSLVSNEITFTSGCDSELAGSIAPDFYSQDSFTLGCCVCRILMMAL